MLVRLAFAVQTAIEPDILIIDEALSVGDIFFQQKCAKRMRDLQSKGTTLLFVSHDLASVRDLCKRTLYLQKGKTVFWGESQQAIAKYYSEDKAPTEKALIGETIIQTQSQSTANRSFSTQDFLKNAIWAYDQQLPSTSGKQAYLLGVAVLDENNQPIETIRMGAKACFKVLLQSQIRESYHVAVEIKNRRGEIVTSCSSYTCGIGALALEANESSYFELELELNFEAGRYTFQVVLSSNIDKANRGHRVDESPWLSRLEINWDYEASPAPFLGMFGPPASARFIPNNSQ